MPLSVLIAFLLLVTLGDKWVVCLRWFFNIPSYLHLQFLSGLHVRLHHLTLWRKLLITTCAEKGAFFKKLESAGRDEI